MKKLIITLLALSAVACAPLPKQAYTNPGQPENLLDKSAERVTLSFSSPRGLADLTDWVNKDQPSRAELLCNKSEANCMRAARILASFNVPVSYQAPKKTGSGAVLVYNRVVTHRCDNSFISNHHNSRNLNHPAFGCSIATNMVQMISDHQQIINPPLSGLPNANQAVQAIKRLDRAGR